MWLEGRRSNNRNNNRNKAAISVQVSERTSGKWLQQTHIHYYVC